MKIKTFKQFFTALFILFLISSPVSAYVFEVPDEIKARAEQITLAIGEERQIGDIIIRYEGSTAIYTKFSVKKPSEGDEWVQFSPGQGKVVTQLTPLWTQKVVIHVGKIGAEGTEDLNYVNDDSKVTFWVENNPNILISCEEQVIEDPKNIGLHTGNFYSNSEEPTRHWFLASYSSPPEILFLVFLRYKPLSSWAISQ